MTVELAGGAALLTGTATTPAGLTVAATMAGAIALVHPWNVVFVDNGGGELVGVIAATALGLAATGPSPWSVDALLNTRRTAR